MFIGFGEGSTQEIDGLVRNSLGDHWAGQVALCGAHNRDRQIQSLLWWRTECVSEDVAGII